MQSKEEVRKKCIFYFRYEMKIEFIPYIQYEIQQFIRMAEQRIHQQESRQQILVVLKKRIKQIDTFFHKHWNDYRAQHVLRGRKMLLELTKKYHQLFALPRDGYVDQTKQSISAFLDDKDRSLSRGSARNQSMKRVLKVGGNRSNQAIKIERQKGASSTFVHGSQEQSLHSTPQNQKIRDKHPSNTELKSKEKRILSTGSQQIKTKTKSVKQIPKMSPTVRKMTKQEYIAYLRSKKGKS